MRLGVMLPTFDPLRTGSMPVARAARRAEAAGFDAVWAGEHLACHAPVLDAGMALATAAAVTERVTVGWSVMLLALRAPAWAAKQAATLQALSDGRAMLGVGVGGEHPEEFEAAGVDVRRRGRLVDAALEALPALLRGEPVGDPTAPEAIPPLAPAADPIPPILVGGRSEHGLRRAARHGDAWMPMWLDPETLAERRERLHALAADHGRPAPRIVHLVLTHVDDDLGRARRVAAEHLRGQYRLPLHVVERWALLGPAGRVADGLARYGEAGADEIVCMALGPDPLDQYERLAALRPRLLRSPA